jgi:hypothetical protein
LAAIEQASIAMSHQGQQYPAARLLRRVTSKIAQWDHYRTTSPVPNSISLSGCKIFAMPCVPRREVIDTRTGFMNSRLALGAVVLLVIGVTTLLRRVCRRGERDPAWGVDPHGADAETEKGRRDHRAVA